MDPALYHREPVRADADVRIRYLGTAGFVVSVRDHTIVLDPYVSRPGGRQTLFRHLIPDSDRIRRYLPAADDVLIGHAHHDHVLDAPELCRQTGARFIGSRDACNVARAAGLPESQLVETAGREDIPSGPGMVRGIPSAHGRVYFNRVALAGNIEKPPPWPPKVGDLRHGLVFNWYLELGGVRVVHIDSAELFEHELSGVECDVLCLCAIGRAYRPGYTEDAIRILKPKVVLPCHWDLFTTPIEDEPFLLPGVDVPGFVDEIRATGTESVVLPFLGEYGYAR
ncbi:MAG: MBL fold metallo-hydrolase [Alphaproteobacteria bacterium]|nr:MBL fold metallo-hydrolase [Alphaproteobacteria bacterium]